MSEGRVSVSRQRTVNVRPPDEEQLSHDGLTELLPTSEKRSHHSSIPSKDGMTLFLDRFLRRGKKQVGVVDSLKAIALSSCTCSAFKAYCLHLAMILHRLGLNLFFIFIPFAWAAHFEARKGTWPEWLVFGRASRRNAILYLPDVVF